MGAERDALTARAFARLRDDLYGRELSFQEIDLRWGITEEQAEAGEVLETCLAEIDACRPYFVAILGDYYGWIDPRAEERLARHFPHLRDYADRSITELEIRHAVLNSPLSSQIVRPLIYRRAPTGDRETPAVARILELISELQAFGCTVSEYSDADDLQLRVYADLRRVIESSHSLPATDSSARRAQAAFRTYHLAGGFHRESEIRRLRRTLWLSRRVVIEGRPGIGKSTLLVAFHRVLSNRGRGDGCRIASLKAASGLWPRVVDELVETGRPIESVDDAKVLLESHLTCTVGVTVIDDISAGRDDLYGDGTLWISGTRPRGRLVVATDDQLAVEELASAGFSRFRLRPLTQAQAGKLLSDQLAIYGKKLTPAQSAKIIAPSHCRHPDYLRVFGELLRVFGLFEELDAEIDRLLTAETASDLFVRLFERLEATPGVPPEMPGLILTLMSRARTGLRESEILAIAGQELEVTGPMHAWAPIGLSLRPFMMDRNGVLSVESQALNEAIVSQYPVSPARENELRAILVRHFMSLRNEARSIDELVYLLPQTDAWPQAIELLSDALWLRGAHARDALSLEAFLIRVIRADPSSAARLSAALEDIAETSADSKSAVIATRLLAVAGRYDTVINLCTCAVNGKRFEGDANDEKELLNYHLLLVEALTATGQLDHALERIAHLKDINTDPVRIGQIRERAALLALDSGHFDIAARLFDDAMTIHEDAGSRRGVARIDQHVASLNLARGDAKQAYQQFSALERDGRRFREPDLLAAALAGRSSAARILGKPRKALRLSRQAESIYRRMGDAAALSRCLVDQALSMIDLDDFDGADQSYSEASGLAREAGEPTLERAILARHLELLDRIGLGGGQLAAEISAHLKDKT